MEIDGQLRLVFPIRFREDGEPEIWAYHTPVSYEVFQANFRAMAATQTKLFENGIAYARQVGAHVAALHLREEMHKDAAARIDAGSDDASADAAATALFADFQRLTMIVAPGPAGWDQMPAAVALQRGVIDAEDWREAEGAIAFFTCSYFLTRKRNRSMVAGAVASVVQGSTTSSPLMEWIASLPSSTTAGNTANAAA